MSYGEVWGCQGKERGPGNTGNMTEGTGENMAEAGQAMVDRCKWGKMVSESPQVLLG